MSRTDLTEKQWRKLAPHLPSNPHHGHVYGDHRHVINGILWRLRTGAPWRDIPPHYGPWQTCYDRFVRWSRNGTWQRLLRVMRAAADEAGLVDWDGAALDATHIKAQLSLSSPEGKRLFLRYFDITQLHMHYISKIARLSLPDDDIEKVEKQVLDLIQEKINIIDKEMVRVEQELRKHNIDSLATYTIVPLKLEARVLGKIGRRLLELTGKIDQLMPMLETMAIDELISENQLNIKKTFFKKSVRSVASVVRTLKTDLQKKSAALANTDKTADGKNSTGDQTDHSSSSDFASEDNVADVVITDTVLSTDIRLMTNKSGNEDDTVSREITKLVDATEPI